jgi:hypothetical protein
LTNSSQKTKKWIELLTNIFQKSKTQIWPLIKTSKTSKNPPYTTGFLPIFSSKPLVLLILDLLFEKINKNPEVEVIRFLNF